MGKKGKRKMKKEKKKEKEDRRESKGKETKNQQEEGENGAIVTRKIVETERTLVEKTKWSTSFSVVSPSPTMRAS